MVPRWRYNGGPAGGFPPGLVPKRVPWWTTPGVTAGFPGGDTTGVVHRGSAVDYKYGVLPEG